MTTNNKLILIIEDDNAISHFISALLQANNYDVLIATNKQEAFLQTTSYHPDLILLDLGLPDIDGLELLQMIREYLDIPIIVVSARVQEQDIVQALDLGADDYITKPFGNIELLARIRTSLRHQKQSISIQKSNIYKIKDLIIDDDKIIVLKNNNKIHLTKIEYKILLLLAQNMGKVLTHEYIIKHIWGPYTNENQALRVNVSNIRHKIEANPANPQYIETLIGVGYRLMDE